MSTLNKSVHPFFVVLSRDSFAIPSKIQELDHLGFPYVIVSGEKFDHPNVKQRKAVGKWDAINFASRYVPSSTDVIVLNDVDTKINNFSIVSFQLENADLVYCDVRVGSGPQTQFYDILNPIRKRFNVAASGELMVMSRSLFEEVLPIPPCIAEDSYILFKALELGHKAHFSSNFFVTTRRTEDAEAEKRYKNRTTLGIYQALKYSRPSALILAFYFMLPLFAPILGLLGQNGRAWSAGIETAFVDYLLGKDPTKF